MQDLKVRYLILNGVREVYIQPSSIPTFFWSGNLLDLNRLSKNSIGILITNEKS